MVDRDVLAAKLGELAERLARVRRHCPPSATDGLADLERFAAELSAWAETRA